MPRGKPLLNGVNVLIGVVDERMSCCAWRVRIRHDCVRNVGHQRPFVARRAQQPCAFNGAFKAVGFATHHEDGVRYAVNPVGAVRTGGQIVLVCYKKLRGRFWNERHIAGRRVVVRHDGRTRAIVDLHPLTPFPCFQGVVRCLPAQQIHIGISVLVG